MSSRKRVAVFFGGRSPEHDVSIITGLQVLNAIDTTLYDPFPVYIDIHGTWFIGEPLRQRSFYLPKEDGLDQLTAVHLSVASKDYGELLPVRKSLFKKAEACRFDVALPAFHGLLGEDGAMQGLFDVAGVPYAGMRTLASSAFMDKYATKFFLKALGIPHLDCAVVHKPAEGFLLPAQEMADLEKNVAFPVCVKPAHLGSSIGVSKVSSLEELISVLPRLFKYDAKIILEPFIEDVAEYNISVRNTRQGVATSAIEKPKKRTDLLDFKEKYFSSPGKTGTKVSTEGMLSLTREIAPSMAPDLERQIRDYASAIFTAVRGAGAPRIDFLVDERSGQVWLNEINPIPGSFAYFLWEKGVPPVTFTRLLNEMIDEAFALHQYNRIPPDPTPEEARLFARP